MFKRVAGSVLFVLGATFACPSIVRSQAAARPAPATDVCDAFSSVSADLARLDTLTRKIETQLDGVRRAQVVYAESASYFAGRLSAAVDSASRQSANQDLQRIKDQVNSLARANDQLQRELEIRQNILYIPNAVSRQCVKARAESDSARWALAAKDRREAAQHFSSAVSRWRSAYSLGGSIASVANAVLVVRSEEKATVQSTASALLGALALAGGAWPSKDTSQSGRTVRRVSLVAGSGLIGVAGVILNRQSNATKKYFARVARNVAYSDAVERLDRRLDALFALTDTLVKLAPAGRADTVVPSQAELKMFERGVNGEGELIMSLREIRDIALQLRANHADEVVAVRGASGERVGDGRTILSEVIRKADVALAVAEAQYADDQSTLRRLRTPGNPPS